jgi:hypothetical protein
MFCEATKDQRGSSVFERLRDGLRRPALGPQIWSCSRNEFKWAEMGRVQMANGSNTT